jgi:hypothetical protein
VVPPLQLQQSVEGPFVVGGAGFFWLHTHDTSRVIHIESPAVRRYTLGEFFDLWGQPLGPEQVGLALGPVTALVDGTVVGGNPPTFRWVLTTPSSSTWVPSSRSGPTPSRRASDEETRICNAGSYLGVTLTEGARALG